MLSGTGDKIPKGDDFIYEVKWDGIRAMIYLEDGQVRLASRNKNNITKQFPELTDAKSFRATCGVFDAEIVCLDKTGRPEFKRVINRLMSSGESNIQKFSKTNPAFCYIFDCLYLDGRSLVNETLTKRREWLKDAIRTDSAYRISDIEEDGQLLLDAARQHELEGIMAKRKDSKYLPGKRTDAWMKIKIRNTRDVVIIGYNQGQGNRSSVFGGLHIAEREGENLVYRGKVGTGFDDATLKEIFDQVKTLKEIKKPIPQKVLDERVSKWVEPKLIAEVTFASFTPDKIFREPVFVRMRPDLTE
jgi:DNA ligase D-like protein (predicted ligase)